MEMSKPLGITFGRLPETLGSGPGQLCQGGPKHGGVQMDGRRRWARPCHPHVAKQCFLPNSISRPTRGSHAIRRRSWRPESKRGLSVHELHRKPEARKATECF